MAEIIGVGCTHYPPLITPDEDRGFPINVTLNRDERLPEELKNPLNWPEPMQAEYGDDQGHGVCRRPPGAAGGGFPARPPGDTGLQPGLRHRLWRRPV